MNIRVEQLRNDLKARQYPIYLVSGDEPLQHQESCDMLRKAAKYYGYEEREVYYADAHFDWQQLNSAANELSLFSTKKVIEIQLTQGKPSDKGVALIEYCEHLPEDVILFLFMAKIEAATKKSKWYKALDSIAGIINVWPIEGSYLNQWLVQRLAKNSLQISPDSIQLLSDRIEGNLLSAAQEIDKLALLYTSSENKTQVSLTDEQVNESVFDNARYNLFDLFDCALSGNLIRASHMLVGLKKEGVALILILTLIAKEVRMLAKMSYRLRENNNINAAMQGVYIFPKRKSLISQALKKQDMFHWQAILQQLLEIDKMAKGRAEGEPWQSLQNVLSGIAGHSYLSNYLSNQ